MALEIDFTNDMPVDNLSLLDKISQRLICDYNNEYFPAEGYSSHGFTIWTSVKKKMIISYEEGNILYENLTNKSFIIYKDIVKDKQFYELTIQGRIYIINNPLIEGDFKHYPTQQSFVKFDSEYFVDEILDAAIIDNILIVAGPIDDLAIHFLIDESGEVTHSANEIRVEKSAHDPFYKRNGISFFHLRTGRLIKSLVLGWGPITIYEKNENLIIACHDEISFVIFLDDFAVLSYGGDNYKKFEEYLLFLPYGGYSTFDTFALCDLKQKRTIDISSIYPFIENKFPVISQIEKWNFPNYLDDIKIFSGILLFKHMGAELYFYIDELAKGKIIPHEPAC